MRKMQSHPVLHHTPLPQVGSDSPSGPLSSLKDAFLMSNHSSCIKYGVLSLHPPKPGNMGMTKLIYMSKKQLSKYKQIKTTLIQKESNSAGVQHE